MPRYARMTLPVFSADDLCLNAESEESEKKPLGLKLALCDVTKGTDSSLGWIS